MTDFMNLCGKASFFPHNAQEFPIVFYEKFEYFKLKETNAQKFISALNCSQLVG